MNFYDMTAAAAALERWRLHVDSVRRMWLKYPPPPRLGGRAHNRHWIAWHCRDHGYDEMPLGEDYSGVMKTQRSIVHPHQVLETKAYVVRPTHAEVYRFFYRQDFLCGDAVDKLTEYMQEEVLWLVKKCILGESPWKRESPWKKWD